MNPLQAAGLSTSRSTPAPRAATPLPRSGSVRFTRPYRKHDEYSIRSKRGELLQALALDERKQIKLTEMGNAVNWSDKAKRRKTTGTGRMRKLGDIPRKFRNGFQTGFPKGTRAPITE